MESYAPQTKRSTKKGRPLLFCAPGFAAAAVTSGRTPLTAFAPAPPIVIFVIATR